MDGRGQVSPAAFMGNRRKQMTRFVRLAFAGLLLSASAARADGWVVFPVEGGAVTYHDEMLENNQTGTILLTVGNFTREPRGEGKGAYRFSFESFHVDCKTVKLKAEKVVRHLTTGLLPVVDQEFNGSQPWVAAGDNRWAQLVVQIACTDAQAEKARSVPNQPKAMELMMELGAAGG